MKSLSHVRLFTTPWTAAYQAPPSMGFSRQEYWSGVPLPSPVNQLYFNLNHQQSPDSHGKTLQPYPRHHLDDTRWLAPNTAPRSSAVVTLGRMDPRGPFSLSSWHRFQHWRNCSLGNKPSPTFQVAWQEAEAALLGSPDPEERLGYGAARIYSRVHSEGPEVPP